MWGFHITNNGLCYKNQEVRECPFPNDTSLTYYPSHVFALCDGSAENFFESDIQIFYSYFAKCTTSYISVRECEKKKNISKMIMIHTGNMKNIYNKILLLSVAVSFDFLKYYGLYSMYYGV